MINKRKVSSGYLRSLSAFMLIVGFLAFGSCPLKKAIHTLIYGSNQTEQAGAGHEKNLASVICLGSENSFTKKMALPERQIEVTSPAFIAIIFTTFWAIWSLFRSEAHAFSFRGTSPESISPVPVYLRNRVLLI